MDPTSLDRLLQEDGVTCTPDGLIVTIHPSWIVKGENRLSYTTLVRLVECCREHHWNTDILSRAEGTPVDSITKSIMGEFVRAIPVGSEISISYGVTDVRRKGYSLRFVVRNSSDQRLCAEVNLVSIFYDSQQQRAVAPPARILEHLASCCTGVDDRNKNPARNMEMLTDE